MGDIDELNSVIGLLQTESLPDPISDCLVDVQHTLFDIGGELAVPGYSMVLDERVDRLETLLDELNVTLAPLKEFILPGGCRAAALCHLARSVCRRAERTLHRAAAEVDIEINDPVRGYINRLSDLLFVMARSLNAAEGQHDVLWRHDRQKRVGA
jgi:cob(I)alamin adenosyltransferase